MSHVPPFMGDLSDDDFAWLERTGVRETVPAGGVIIREGEPLDALFVILEGSFGVTATTLDDTEVIVLGPGEIAGEMSYIHNHLPTGTVSAVVDAVVLRIPRSALDEKIRRDPGFAARFHKVVLDFVVARVYEWWRGKTHPLPEQHRTREETDSLRVYELIERMLRNDFP